MGDNATGLADMVADQPTLSLVVTSSESGEPGEPAEPTARIEVTLGETVGRYQVRRQLGSGGMGQVYLARDVVLGRSVALKIVGLNRSIEVSTEQFLHEARAIARLNHPNIVQLYDFGEYKGGFYLALEYVEGDTLRERVRAGTMALDEALRHARAIADGLCHAHDNGVYHCDLKPSNVMVGKDGRVRVVDFGIARTGDSAATASSGTPDWMAPEQWTGGRVTDRVDSWSLGIVTAQLLTGRHPLGDESSARREAARDPARVAAWTPQRRGVPPAVVELVIRSLEREPTLRPSASEWARVLDATLRDGGGDAAIEDGPYRGLAAFDEKHARFYFGRELEIDAFLERLRATPHLPIVGPSGAGKSSFLHAGVIPRLRAREPWTVIAFRPGADPVSALARQVLAAIRDDRPATQRPVEAQLKAQVQAFRAELLETPTLLAARLATIAGVTGGRVLLAVDQLEEAFTQGAGEAERQRFLEMLVSAADDPADPVRVVVTVRDDFVGKLPDLRSLFVVKQLAVDDIRRTITGPLARYDYQFDDPAIVDDLIAEVGSAAAANLPLLQFACRTLWDGRNTTRRCLLRATYREMGGLAGALGRHADHALAELSPDEHRTTRQLLLQLVVGTTRRSVARDQLVASAGAGADAGRVLDRLLAARLLVQRNAGDGESPLVEIAHESLVQTWSQLARWLDESREELRLLEELTDAAKLWERRGKRSEHTWSERDIATARHRAVQLDLALPPRILEFFAAGDLRNRLARRRRWTRIGITFALASAVAVLLLLKFVQDRWRDELIRNNLGTVIYTIAPFDRRAGAVVAATGDPMPDLTVTVYSARPDDTNEPGDPIPDKLVGIVASGGAGNPRVLRISAPGGAVWLRLDHRGRPREHCPPSWIRVQAFPGYRIDDIKRLELPVPTCQATLADTVKIDAGPFWYGGPGEPPAKHYGEPDYTEPERLIDLPAFAMDRTEVSNAAYEPFARLDKLTGYLRPVYTPTTVHVHDGEPAYPVSDIDAFAASAYCRYMGKRLPSDAEWTKAARGGLMVNGNPNRSPRRLYPWGNAARPECVNQDFAVNKMAWTRPVDSLSCGASPYGILQLAGNVQEWISRDGQTDRDNPLHALRGGSTDDDPGEESTTTVFRNHRDPHFRNYSNGVRCIVDLERAP